jgi:aspartate kinase
MALIVAKFGGTSVADLTRIEAAAEKIIAETRRGNNVAIVVSAMSGVTNQLVDYCTAVSPLHDAREYDVVVSSGEQVTAGLMALMLQKKGVTARSWMGWQIPIKTDDMHSKARIEDIHIGEIKSRLLNGEVVVVPGFQGITERKRISTLGRGGSDTTALALAAALGAERCDIYTDVKGVYTTNPHIVPNAKKIDRISYEEMLELAALGAKVLHPRSVEISMKMDVPLQVLSSFDDAIGSDLPGTLVTREEDIMEQQLVTGIAYTLDDAKITLLGVPDVPGVAARVFSPLAEANVNVDMIVQNVSADGKTTDITFTVPENELTPAIETLKNVKDLQYKELITSDNVAKVSVIGIGMKSHSGVANTMFNALSGKGINIEVISTSEIKISVLISADYTELAVRALHAAYGLDE